MEIMALLIGVLAGLAFLAKIIQTAVPRTAIDWTAVGLLLITIAWIVQLTILSGTHVHTGP